MYEGRTFFSYMAGDADVESLRAHLSTALPEYMVPAHVRLEALPVHAEREAGPQGVREPGAETA